ncbi:MAG: DUF389 domain-containing protein [Acidimicrobiia bacterium]|nr:DUF389 domain-containing protein [Acidimicrobiia bacterium]
MPAATSTASPPGSDHDRAPSPFRPDQVWTRRWKSYSDESRQRIQRAIWCKGEAFVWRFAVMMVAASIIAAVGLNLSSTAVVIGAMLVAPLMTPIVGFAAAAVGGNPDPARRCAVFTVLASAGTVATAYVTSAALPVVGNPVTSELLARTSPDVRDLLVAVAAGTAGAYATAREEISSSLPGAAVAVALVPPLAAVGICLELGRWELAFGAFLLYAANLIGILVAAAVVMALTGFAEPPFIRGGGRTAAIVATASAVALVVVTLPLLAAVDAAASGARRDAAVQEAVAAWSEASAEPVTLRGVSVIDGTPVRVEIDLVGNGQLDRSDTLVAALEAELGDDVEIDLRWATTVSTDRAIDRPDVEPEPATDPREAVERALAQEGLSATVTVEGVHGSTDERIVDLAGSDVTVVDESLRSALLTALGADEVEVRWTNRIGVTSEAAGVERRVQEWARRANLEVLRVSVDEDAVWVAVAATEAPNRSDVAELEERLDRSVELRWAPLLELPADVVADPDP